MGEHEPGGHYVEKCRDCYRVITQCRCKDPDKPVRLSLCWPCRQRVIAESPPKKRGSR